MGMRSALLCAYSAEELFLISRLSRSAERSKRYFHGRGRNGKRHLQRRFLRKRGAAGGRLLPLGGAVAQRLRGFLWRSEKSVKAIAPTGAALAFLCFDFFFRIVKGVQPLETGCGTQHPLRALGGTRVLLAAAPTTPPCFRRWRRSSSLLLRGGWSPEVGRGGVGTPLPASGPAERPCTLKASRKALPQRGLGEFSALEPERVLLRHPAL